ncbi:5-oxopent-3-ene-1,2,5-tricarboxylate decarboxylase/2-hydroxyhepta-2,4-diene-1,7-dioate isomerase [Comamonas odontotermitis]|uniref:5-oxopent-3-ene-1,2,5-tricarboxylate decarboxylase/2-hydroxyhepta-2,4-diene-1,7-dioate isomerase n=1 Tax=Comamonas odontotermitis TaxID=379895 RepID=A0ABR6RGF0_9BURK|nr:fumarylacetoacetate hydrolase family protein [Comamonas odontotermitis]MBB6578207.1 5-oxopent-3-ene-1,2,5-tricarboxylate decarboxylase/2-hydroxyhepta-2,4-diene-1,7-dioate isomerase [Comamonas odontotermitis]
MIASFPAARATVYGVLLNDRSTLQRLMPQFDSAPYKAAPRAPVLYIKPRNTFAGNHAAVAIPADPGEVRIDATIGLVIGSTATRVSASKAMEHVAGFVVVSDVTLPHENYYRPAIRQRDRDGFCPMGEVVAARYFDLNQATLHIEINGKPVYERRLDQLVRPAAQLIADVTEFMTLSVGDVLLLGAGEGSPVARPGDAVRITVPGLGTLNHTVALETQP